MATKALAADPYNLIITGVGGQGNVLASKDRRQHAGRPGILHHHR